jgi:hypothetical protein
MAIDATAREANLRDSIKKYFIDSLFTTEHIPVSFDIFVTSPKIQGKSVDRWVSLAIGDKELDTLSSCMLEVYCCTRKDPENFRLSQLRDTVMSYLLPDTDDETYKRIPFYRSAASGAWTLLGALMITNIYEGMDMIAEDQTKFKTLYVQLRYVAKL